MFDCSIVIQRSNNQTFKQSNRNMEYISLIWEMLLLGIAVYLYAYMRGFIKAKTPEQQKKVNEFRKDNAWMTYAAIALGAIMVINLALRFIGK
jgi:hypothetical protein